MTAEVINLRQARKAAKRRDKDVRASENRSLYGRTKEERRRDRFERAQADAHVDGHRLGHESDGGGHDRSQDD